jgi:hypothetical protein
VDLIVLDELGFAPLDDTGAAASTFHASVNFAANTSPAI